MQWLAVLFLQTLTELLWIYFIDTLFITKGLVLYFCYTISQVTVSLTDHIPSIILGPFSLVCSVSYSILDVVLYLISNSNLIEKKCLLHNTFNMHNISLTFGLCLKRKVLLAKNIHDCDMSLWKLL